MIKKIELIIKMLPIASILIILIGNLYVYWYFQEFDINIYSYINLNEIFIIFLPKLYTIFNFLITISLFYICSFFIVNKIKFSFEEKKKIIVLLLIFSILLITYFLIRTFLFGFRNENLDVLFIKLIFELFYLFFMILIYFFIFKIKIESIKLYYVLIIFFLILFIQVIRDFSYYESKKYKLQSSNDNYKIYFTDTTYNTNNSFRLLSITNEYVFFYEKTNIIENIFIRKKNNDFIGLKKTTDNK